MLKNWNANLDSDSNAAALWAVWYYRHLGAAHAKVAVNFKPAGKRQHHADFNRFLAGQANSRQGCCQT